MLVNVGAVCSHDINPFIVIGTETNQRMLRASMEIKTLVAIQLKGSDVE